MKVEALKTSQVGYSLCEKIDDYLARIIWAMKRRDAFDRFGGDHARQFVVILSLSLILLAFWSLLIGCRYIYCLSLLVANKMGYLMIAAYIGSAQLFNGRHLMQRLSF